MIPFDDVFSQVIAMASPDSSQEQNLTNFCQAAIASISKKMKPDADGSDIRIIMAAAALAYCRYIQSMAIEESDITSMKAGDVTISKNSAEALSAAVKFAEATAEDARELLIDTSFAFAAI